MEKLGNALAALVLIVYGLAYLFVIIRKIVLWVYPKIVTLFTAYKVFYHKKVDQDYWAMRRARRNLHQPDYTINRNRQARSPNTRLINQALVFDEIHIKWSHFDNAGFLGNYDVDTASCSFCQLSLPYIACFLNNHYVCFYCVTHSLLPRFCKERFLLLSALEIFPRDIVLLVMRKIVLLSFDLDQIREMDKVKPPCFVHICDTEENRLLLKIIQERVENICFSM